MKRDSTWDEDEIDDCITASDPDVFRCEPTELLDAWSDLRPPSNGPPSNGPGDPPWPVLVQQEHTMIRSFFDPTPPDSMPNWVAPTPRPVSPWAVRSSKASIPDPKVFPRPPSPIERIPQPAVPAAVEPPPPSSTPAARRVDVVWFDPEDVARLRAASEGLSEVDDAACMKRLLSSADRRGVEDAIDTALTSASPPLVVLAGELRFPFDELARLRAVVAGAMPLAKGDDELERIVGAARELLETPWVDGACTPDQLIDAIHTVLRQRKRKSASLTALQAGVERVLLRERRYQRRTVFGKTSLRTLFGRPGQRRLTPAYFPEEVASVLPMFHVLEVTLVAEPHMSQDQYESSPHALRVLALGRSSP